MLASPNISNTPAISAKIPKTTPLIATHPKDTTANRIKNIAKLSVDKDM